MMMVVEKQRYREEYALLFVVIGHSGLVRETGIQDR